MQREQIVVLMGLGWYGAQQLTKGFRRLIVAAKLSKGKVRLAWLRASDRRLHAKKYKQGHGCMQVCRWLHGCEKQGLPYLGSNVLWLTIMLAGAMICISRRWLWK